MLQWRVLPMQQRLLQLKQRRQLHRQRADFVIDARQTCRFPNISLGTTVGPEDVLEQGAGKQPAILTADAELTPYCRQVKCI